jgi:predicted MPP superfamily phosphohydrolase
MSFLILLLFVPNILLLGLGIYGFYIEPFRLTVNRIEVPVAGLQKTFRIVQLSDLHVERTTKREQAIPSLVENLNPDMIVLTGDYLIESRFNFPETIEALKDLVDQLHAPLGVYAVNGNVETPGKLKDLFQDLDVHVLNNESIRLPEIREDFVLIGLSFHNWSYDSNQLSRLMKSVQPDDYTLLLYHKPDLAYAAEEEGVDLYLAGHTHGGQVRLPFYGAIYANSRYGKTFEMGLYHLGNTTLYVNRGLGFTGGSAPRVRFLAPPEVLIVDLVPE